MYGGPAAVVGNVGTGAAREQQARLLELSPTHELVQHGPRLLEGLVELRAMLQQQIEQVLARIPRRSGHPGIGVEAAVEQESQHLDLTGSDDEVRDVDVVSPAARLRVD